MAYHALDLTLISAELKNANTITKLHAYAVASSSDDPQTEQCTPVDRLGGQNPTWNHTFRFFIPADVVSAARLYIRVLIRSKHMFGDRDIGESLIPLKYLVPLDGIQTPIPATYLIGKEEPGKLRGFLNTSYKLGEQVAAPPVSSRSHVDVTSTYRPSMAGYATPPSRYRYAPFSYGSLCEAPPPSTNYGYGYGYGYYPQQSTVQQGTQMQNINWNNFGMGLGTGFVGGRRFGDDMTVSAAYNAGYVAGFDNALQMGGGFHSRI